MFDVESSQPFCTIFCASLSACHIISVDLQGRLRAIGVVHRAVFGFQPSFGQPVALLAVVMARILSLVLTILIDLQMSDGVTSGKVWKMQPTSTAWRQLLVDVT